MKNFLGLLVLTIVMSSCNIKKHALELNLTKGETYNQVMSNKTIISQKLMGEDVIMGMLITGTMSYKVLDFQNSLYDMEVRYKDMTMTMNLPNGKMEFSSLNIDSADIFSTILGLMIDKPFNIKMTKSGKITEVRNIDNLYAGIFDNFPYLDEAQVKQLLNQLDQAYGEKSFIGNLEACTAIFPNAPVALNAKWKVKIKLEASIPTNVISSYKLTQVSDSCYHISGTSKLKTFDKEDYVESDESIIKYDLSGEMVSDIIVDRTTGWVLNATLVQNVEGYATFKANAQRSTDVSVPMVVKNIMTYSNK